MRNVIFFIVLLASAVVFFHLFIDTLCLTIGINLTVGYALHMNLLKRCYSIKAEVG